MNGDVSNHVNRDTPIETRAAELARAAYRVALQSGTQGTWLDLELNLWRALADTLKTSEQNCFSSDS
jgi:hypothetical protein